MKLTTKCPRCSTVFDVSLEILQQRKGYTRCVSCAHIFDGFEEVLPEDEATPEQIKQNVSPSIVDHDINNQADMTQTEGLGNNFIIRTRSIPENKPPLESNHKISDLEHPIADSFDKEFTISDSAQLPPENNHSIDSLSLENIDNDDDSYHAKDVYQDDDDEYIDVTSRFVSAIWVFLIAISVATLLLQAVYVFRVQIAESMPQTRPRLQALCDKIGCDMPWVRKPEHILIIHSSLQSQSNMNKDTESGDDNNLEEAMDDNIELASEYVLQVVVRNSYNQDQEWPSLILELTDAAGAKIARKNISAQQYLTDEYINKPFLASSEYQVQLPIKLQGLKVNGYQVTTFFP